MEVYMKGILTPLLITLLLLSSCQPTSSLTFRPTPDLSHVDKPALDLDFTKPQPDWCTGGLFPFGEFYCEQDEFHLLNKGSGNIATWTTGNFHDFTLQAEIYSTSNSGSYGIAFGGNDDAATYYIFRIRPDGQYQLIKWSPTELVELIQWTESSAIKLGQETNRLQVTVIRRQIKLSVNNHKLVEMPTTFTIHGSIGPVATDEGHAVLKTLKVWNVYIIGEADYLQNLS
jgi:hypothetical protein